MIMLLYVSIVPNSIEHLRVTTLLESLTLLCQLFHDVRQILQSKLYLYLNSITMYLDVR